MPESQEKREVDLTELEKIGLTDLSHAQMESFRTAHETQVLTILISDLEGSTRLQSELGNFRATELVHAHQEIFRALLAAFDGQEVDTAGDSFLVVFAAPSEAVKFALHMQAAMRRAIEKEPLIPRVRVGIHQGQVVVERSGKGTRPLDIYGQQVSTAARISDLGGGGQILCSRSVFDDARAILRGDDFAGLKPVVWLNHGPYGFKGVEDAYDVCETGEEGLAPLSAPPAGVKGWPAGYSAEELGWRPAVGVMAPGTNWVMTERLGRESSEKEGEARFKGEFGEVWRAFNDSDKSWQVFKFCFKREHIPALKREARLLKRLKKHRHPNLVEVYDVTVGDKPPYYLTMEYVEGPSLEDWLAQSPDMEQRLEVIAQIADALDMVHAEGIYHRDIKPSNILLTRRGDGAILAKLTDFGLGAAEDRDLLKSIYASRVIGAAGTWDYIAPELREGGPPSPQSDIYSLGLTLFQVASGNLRLSLVGWDEQVRDQILSHDIKRCIALDPAERWERAGDLARALRGHDQRLKELQDKREREERLRQAEAERAEQKRRLKRMRLILLMVGLFAVMTLSFGGYVWVLRGKAVQSREIARQQEQLARKQRDEAERQRRIALSERAEARHQLGAALLERARSLDEQGRKCGAFLTALRAVGFAGYARDADRFPSLIRPGTDPWLRAKGLAMANGPGLVWQSPSLWRNPAPLFALALSPDGKTLAAAGGDFLVRLWDMDSGELIASLKGAKGAVLSLAFSPDGKTLASAGDDGEIRLWNIGAVLLGRCREEEGRAATPEGLAILAIMNLIKGHQGPVNALGFDPSGGLLASGGRDETLRLWDVRDPADRSRDRALGIFDQDNGTIDCLAFSPDGKSLAWGGEDGRVRVGPVQGKGLGPVRVFELDRKRIFGLAFSPDGKRLAACGKSEFVHLLDPENGRVVKTFRGGLRGAAAIMFSPDGKTMASAGLDSLVRVWSPDRDEEARALAGHTNYVRSLAFSPDGNELLSCGGDRTLRFWDLADRDNPVEKRSGQGHIYRLTSVEYSPDGRVLATSGKDPVIRIWDAASGRLKRELAGNERGVNAVRFSPDGKILASAGDDRTVRVWDWKTGLELARVGNGTELVEDLSFSADGSLLALAVKGFAVRVYESSPQGWRLASTPVRGDDFSFIPAAAFAPRGRLLAAAGEDGRITLHDLSNPARPEFKAGARSKSGRIAALAFDPMGRLLAAVGGDGAVRLREMDSLDSEGAMRLSGRAREASCIAFSPDGSVLAAGGRDGAVSLWDAASARETAVFEGHGGPVSALAFSSGGKSLATACEDGALRVWSAARAGADKGLETNQGHGRAVTDLDFSRDGKLLASAGLDGAVNLWRPADGRRVGGFKVDQGGVFSLSLSPDGSRLAAGTRGGRASLWDVRKGGLITRIGSGTDELTAPVVRFAPKGLILAVNDLSDSIHLFDISKDPAGKKVGELFTGRIGGFFAPAYCYSRDGSRLLSATDDGRVHVWDNLSGDRLFAFDSVPGRPGPLACSPDGRYLASGSPDGAIRIWNATASEVKDENRLAAKLEGCAGGVSYLDYSPDSSLLAAACGDGEIRLWDMSGPSLPEPLAVIQGRGRPALCLRFSPDSTILASGGQDAKLRLWRLHRPKILPEPYLDQFRFSLLDLEFIGPKPNLYGSPGFRLAPVPAE